MAIVIKRATGIKLLLRASNAAAYPVPTVTPMNADIYFQYKGDAKAPEYLGTFPVGKQVQIPFATDLDRDIVITTVSRGPLGQQHVPDLRDAPRLEVQSQREQRKPIIGQMGDSTNNKAIIGVSYFPRHMHTRRIQVATDVDFTDIVAEWYQDIDRTGKDTPRLTEQFSIQRATPGSSTATFYIRIAHTAFSTTTSEVSLTYQQQLEGLRWGPDSDPLMVTLADASGAGGTTGSFNPFTATFQGYGSGASNLLFSVPMPGDGGLAALAGFPTRIPYFKTFDLTETDQYFDYDKTFQILRTGGGFTGTTAALNVKTNYKASGSAATTTGSINSGANSLTLTGALDFKNGQGITVVGAGASGANLHTTITSGGGTVNLILAANASTTVSGATVRHDDTAAIALAVTDAQSLGRALHFPDGTYYTDKITGIADSMAIIGAGMRRTILKARDANRTVIEVTGASFHSMLIENIGIEGAGTTSGSSGHGIHVHDNGGLVFQITIRNVEVRLCGGKGIYLLENFSTLIDGVSISDNGGNGIEGEFDNSCTFINCYIHGLANNKVGYRIYSGSPVLIGCNGIDSGSNTWWGVFGKNLAGGDDTDSYCRASLINCNVEDSKFGVWCKAGSYISNMDGTTFWAPASTSGAIAIQLDFVDADTIGMLGSGCRFALKSGASWANGSPIRANATPFLMVGNRVAGGQYYNTALPHLVDLPYLSVATNSTTNKASVFANSLAVGALDSDIVPTIATFRNIGSSAFPVKDVFVGEKVDLAAGATQIIGANVLLQNGANPIVKLTGSSGASIIGRVQVLDASYMQIGTDTNHDVVIRSNNVDRWIVDANGTLRPASDNTRDIGYNGGRVKDIHIAGRTYWNVGLSVYDKTGTGSPEGVETASPGARFWRTDGGAGTTLYVKETGTGASGWVAYGSPSGGGITGSGTTGKIAKFTASGAVGDSIASESGSTFSVAGQYYGSATNAEIQLVDPGTGTIQARLKVFTNDRAIVGTITNHDLSLYSNNVDQWRVKAAGHFFPEGNAVRDIGDATHQIRDAYIGQDARIARRLVGVGSVPTASTSTGAGTSPSISLDGSQLGCFVSLTTGSSPAANAKIFDLVLAAAPNYYIASLTPVNSAAAALSGSQRPYVSDADATTTTVRIKSGASLGLSPGTTYEWYVTFIAV